MAHEQRAIPKGVTRDPVPADGNCLFHGAARILTNLRGDGKIVDAATLRAEVATHMLKHKERYIKEWDNEMPDKSIAQSFEAYVAEIEKDKVWCTNLELAAIARMYNVRFYVFCIRMLDEPYVLHSTETKRIGALVFDGCHFDVLKPDGGVYPQALLDISAGPPLVPTRGGGKSSSGASAPSRKTVWTPTLKSRRTVWTPKSDKPSPRKGTVWSSASSCKGMPSHASPRQHDDSDNIGEALTPRALYLSRGSSFADESGKAIWACPFCPYRVEHATGDHICKMRYMHLKSAHNGEGLPGNLSRPANVVVPRVRNFFWKCPLCPAGITRDMRQKISVGVYYDERWRHCQAAHPKVAKDRWKALCASKVVVTAARKQRTRISMLNVGAARSVAQVDPAQDLVRFTWPVVVNKRPRPKKALCLHQAWKCRKCGRCFSQFGKAKIHACRISFNTSKKIIHSRLTLLRKHRKLCDTFSHGVDVETLNNVFKGAEFYLCNSKQ